MAKTPSLDMRCVPECRNAATQVLAVWEGARAMQGPARWLSSGLCLLEAKGREAGEVSCQCTFPEAQAEGGCSASGELSTGANAGTVGSYGSW